jgi:hypothetical protein
MQKLRANVYTAKTIIKARMGHAVKRSVEEKASYKLSV